MVAAMIAVGACTSDVDKGQVGDPVSIKLTATVKAEILRLGDDTTWTRNGWSGSMSSTMSSTRAVQETSIDNDEAVYLWADKGSAGTYDYLKAWALTSDGDGNLSSTTTQYYPADGDGLTFRAVHGNFIPSPVDGNTAIGDLTHTVDANQSVSGAYEHSDLMYGEGSGSSGAAGSVNFTHKLSKIEINIIAGAGFVPNNMENVVVQIKNVKPSITINVADGTLGLASGDAITVTARRTGTLFEAVIPPQELADGSIIVSRNGVTATIPSAVASFATSSKYVYYVSCTNKDKRLNPLWYVAENNVQSYNISTKRVTLETYPAATGSSQCYSWYDGIAYFSKQGTSYDEYWAGDITDGSTDFYYHLPCQKEWYSVMPSDDSVFDTSSFLPGGGKVASSKTCIFGYSSETKVGIDDWSYWSSYTADSNVRYAIRFLGTAYCSIWKYEFSGSVLTITSKLIDYLAADADDSILSSVLSTYMVKSDSWWNSNEEYEGDIQRKFYAVGYVENSYVGGSGSADVALGTLGLCLATTETGATMSRFFRLGSGSLKVDITAKKWGASVRLFRNTGVGEARSADPGISLTSNLVEAGDVIANNGLVYKTGALASVYGHTPLALIYGVGAGTSGNSSYTHGIAIALADAGGGAMYQFKNANDGVCGVASTDFATAKSYMDGITYTATYLQSGHSSHGHAAAAAANNYTPTISGAKWFLPSLGQWCNFLNWCNGGTVVNTAWGWNANKPSYTNVRTALNIAGGSGALMQDYYYWSSTEYNTPGGIYLCFNSNPSYGIQISYDNKTVSVRVRPFLAW